MHFARVKRKSQMPGSGGAFEAIANPRHGQLAHHGGSLLVTASGKENSQGGKRNQLVELLRRYNLTAGKNFKTSLHLEAHAARRNATTRTGVGPITGLLSPGAGLGKKRPKVLTWRKAGPTTRVP